MCTTVLALWPRCRLCKAVGVAIAYLMVYADRGNALPPALNATVAADDAVASVASAAIDSERSGDKESETRRYTTRPIAFTVQSHSPPPPLPLFPLAMPLPTIWNSRTPHVRYSIIETIFRFKLETYVSPSLCVLMFLASISSKLENAILNFISRALSCFNCIVHFIECIPPPPLSFSAYSNSSSSRRFSVSFGT